VICVNEGGICVNRGGGVMCVNGGVISVNGGGGDLCEWIWLTFTCVDQGRSQAWA